MNPPEDRSAVLDDRIARLQSEIEALRHEVRVAAVETRRQLALIAESLRSAGFAPTIEP